MLKKPISNLLPNDGLFRISKIIPALIPVSKSTWWAGVKSWRFPAPVKLGPKTTCWRLSDIHTLIESYSGVHVVAKEADAQQPDIGVAAAGAEVQV